MAGTLYVVATPIGNLEDITARALRILREVTLIAAEDTRRTAQLLARYAIATRTTSLHEHNETRKAGALLARLQQGEHIALVSDAGTPTVSDPGAHLIRAAIAEGIRVESIPGPSAILAAVASSGLGDGTFLFLGFPPTRSKDRSRWFGRVRDVRGTVVFFEAPHRILRTLADLQAAVGDCEVAVGRELTKAHEELVRGPISDVLGRILTPRGEFTVVAELGLLPDIGETVPEDDATLLAKFGEITENGELSRRDAVASLADRYRLPVRAMYARLESAKKSVK